MTYLKSDQLRGSKKPRSKLRKKSNRSRASDIPPNVRMEVKLRDNNMCIVQSCRNMNPHLHHVYPRSLGGMGVTKNIVSLCIHHHTALHNGDIEIKKQVDDYMFELYGNIDLKEIKYDKHRR